MKGKGAIFALALGTAFLSVTDGANAQSEANAATAATAADTARFNAEADRLKAEAAKIDAQADLERTRITSLGVPSYAGTTKLNANAGDMEAMLLTAPVVRLAGSVIAGKVPAADNVLLLTRDDAFDFGLVGSVTAEIDGLTRQFEALGFKPAGPTRGPAIKLIPGAVAIISAIAGMARSETEVTAATVPVSDSMLLTAVAGTLRTRARLPAAAIGTVDVADDGSNSPLLARLGNLVFSRVTTADAQGAVPIARAARLELLMTQVGGVLRVHVEKSGGSLTNTKNIATFFGADPIRVSGGLVASYILTRPADGAVIDAGIDQCRTTMARLRSVQEGTVSYRGSGGRNGDAPTAEFCR